MRNILTLYIIPAVFCIWMASCDDKSKPPLTREEMHPILLDLHMAEAYSMMVTDSLHFLREKNKDSLAIFYNDVLSHHNVSLDKFMNALEWYRMHPQELDSVYADIITELSVYEAAYP